ncbi:MAG: radical SAM protein, partial [bacterium]|nr:radical SAM protein [bacterium]
KIRFRSPENVVDEIIFLHREYGVKEIHFEDDNLTMKRSHIQKICELMIKNNLHLSWACPNGIRADKIDEDLIALMKKSGCYLLAFGIESGSPEILQKVKKNENLQTIEKAIELVDKFGLICQGFFIFGLPGETKKTIRESIEFAKRSKLTRAQFVILDVLPGSELWGSLKGQFEPNFGKKSYREPEWLPEGITREVLISAQQKALLEFYLRPHILWSFVKYAKLYQFKYFWRRFKDYQLFKLAGHLFPS